MSAGFHEVRFPLAVGFGSTGGPERRTDVVLLASGHEERNARWADSRRRYNAGTGVRSLADLHTLLAFFEERRGRLYGFRWRDRADWKSCAPGGVPAAGDQAIGTAGSWLFPGEDGGHKGIKTLSGQVGERVFDATGLQLTAHQFRHAAAAMFLKSEPGAYERVRQFLGHRSIITTTRFYAGLESLQASQMFGQIIADEMNAQSAGKRRGPPRGAPRRPVPIIRSEVKKRT